MSIRLRLAVTFGVLILAFTSLMGVTVYRSAANALSGEVDRSLLEPATRVARQLDGPGGPGRLPAGLLAQSVNSAGAIASIEVDPNRPAGAARRGEQAPPAGTASSRDLLTPTSFPVTSEALAMAQGSSPETLAQSVETREGLWRVVSVRSSNGIVQVGRDYSYVSSALDGLARTAAIIAALAVLAGFVIAWILAGALTGRLTRLTQSVRALPHDGSASGEVPAEGHDEVGALARAFNQLLGSMYAARERERRLMEDVAHELRTPLTSLKTNTQLLPQYSRLSEEEQRALAREMSEEADELISLVEQALTLSSPQDTLTLTSVDLSEVARYASRLAVRSGVEVSLTGQAVVVGDEMMLRRAVSNVVSNATKFAPHSPIDITVEVSDGLAQVRVRDHGEGFPEKSMHLVGQRFWRADEHRSVKGSGLGLSIVSDIAQAHGGSLSVENSPEGGAVVTLTVPCARTAR